jgi:hypothetical protein
MANNIMQQLRSNTTAIPGSLLAGQLAYSSNGNILYIGSPASGTPVVPIGGQMNPGVLTANQALVANSLSGLNNVITATLTLSGNATVSGVISANASTGTAGYVLTSGGASANAYWIAPTSGVAGSTTQVQFNNGGILAGNTNLTFTPTTSILAVGNSISVGPNVVLGNSSLSILGTTTNSTLTSSSLKLYYTNAAVNSISIIPDTISIGSSSSNTTIQSGIITLGNTTVNNTINSTTYSGTANNSSYLGGTAASGYQTTAGLSANVATLTSNNSAYLGGVSAASYQLNSTLAANVATLTSNNSTNFGGNPVSYYANISSPVYTTSVSVGANVIANTSAIFFGNSTINTIINSTTFVSGNSTVYNTQNSSTESFVGLVTNSTLNATVFFLGNTTTNTSINTTSITTTNGNFTSLTVSGNLIVTGTVETINTSELIVNANMIELSSGHTTTDVVDSGWFSPGGNSTSTWYSLFGRIAAKSTNSNPYFYIGVSNTNPNTSLTFDISAANATVGSLQAYLVPYGAGGGFVVNSTAITITANSTVNANFTANSLLLSTALGTASGGTGKNAAGYAAGDILYAATSSPSALTSLAVGANGTVLQITNNLPAFSVLDAGTF